ncbi:MAG: hypothetical protein AAFS06_05890 [Cyanobacteria bacterium J06631_12]
MSRRAVFATASLTGLLTALLYGLLAGPPLLAATLLAIPAPAKQTSTNQISVKQVPVDQPGRAPVEPIEFPDETPTEPVDIPAEQSSEPHLESPSEPAADPSQAAVEAEGRSLATWRLFTSDVGQFRVALPSPPAIYTFAPEVKATTSRMYMQMQLVSATHLEIYAAAFVESADFLAAEGNLDRALRSCVENLSEQVLQDDPQEISLGDYRGIEASFVKPDGSLQISRCYLVGARAYMLTATSEPFDPGAGFVPLQPDLADSARDAERSPSIQAFFDSFEILEADSQ